MDTQQMIEEQSARRVQVTGVQCIWESRGEGEPPKMYVAPFAFSYRQAMGEPLMVVECAAPVQEAKTKE